MMAKIFATLKAIVTRLFFVAHGFIAIWQVTQFKKNSFYWYLSVPMLLLVFEGIFTLTIKENQEWKWFCPSVFLYLASVVPAIWLLELDKVEKRLKAKENTFNLTTSADFRDLKHLLGVEIKIPDIPLSTEMWVTLIEQFLMLTLIIGRWMLPKGDLTRDQLSQLLLVYIGTAADIIEFFDSFKDDKIASEPILVLLTLAIWSWSLIQFTIVLTATKSRKSRLGTNTKATEQKGTSENCCNIDVWGIILNITLQDAPFLVFRLLIIIHFNIISYMNVFFTCKNTLVILLQLYRLNVVYSENTKKSRRRNQVPPDGFELTNISIITKPDQIHKTAKGKRTALVSDMKHYPDIYYESECSSDDRIDEQLSMMKKEKMLRKLQSTQRKDTGYSTGGSSHTPLSADEKKKQRSKKCLESDPIRKPIKKPLKIRDAVLEETDYVSEDEEWKLKRKKLRKDQDSEFGAGVKAKSRKSKERIVKVVSSSISSNDSE